MKRIKQNIFKSRRFISTFRYRNLLIVYQEIAGNQFPGKFRKFKLLHFYAFYDGLKGHWYRSFRFYVLRNYWTAGI